MAVTYRVASYLADLARSATFCNNLYMPDVLAEGAPRWLLPSGKCRRKQRRVPIESVGCGGIHTLQRSHAWPVRDDVASRFFTEPEKSLFGDGRW